MDAGMVVRNESIQIDIVKYWSLPEDISLAARGETPCGIGVELERLFGGKMMAKSATKTPC